MKLETLAKRLAEKTNCPDLEQVILGKAELSNECLIWSGRVTNPTSPTGFRWDHGEMRYGRNNPYPMINFQGRPIGVHRLLFLLIIKPNFEFRMQRTCTGSPNCVNPMHFDILAASQSASEPEPEFTVGSWTKEEVLQMLEILLTEQEPKSWEDVNTSPLMDSAPHEMIRMALISLGKGYLT